MKLISIPQKFLWFSLILLLIFSSPLFSQDAVKVDPTHYTVEFENEFVRVLRITYGPGEKSVMHEHPDAVAINLIDGKVMFHHPEGDPVEINSIKGTAGCTKATKHLPENVGKNDMEVILVEMKHKIKQ